MHFPLLLFRLLFKKVRETVEKQFLEIGKIVTTHGIKGEVRVQAWCDAPEMLCEFDEFYINEGKSTIEIDSARVHKNVVVMKLHGVDTVNDANLYRNQVLYIDREDLELPEDTYFIQDLMGLQVVDANDGHRYGEIVDITQTGANDVYHIKTPDGQVILVPAIADVVRRTDIENQVMEIVPLLGLFEDAEEIRE